MDKTITDTPQRVVVFGCGNIGSRLLQSLASVDGAVLHVDAFEPVEAARKLAEERFAEVLKGRPHTLRFVEEISGLSGPCAFAIVATDARNRLAALSALVAQTPPARLLLEKVLFTRAADYEAAAALIAGNGIDVWVNTSRNEWSGYQDLKAEIGGKRITRITASGSDWGLACNGIHFLSLAEFLTGEPIESLSWPADQAPSVREAKRPGYSEVIGTLEGRTSGGTEIRLISSDEPGQPLTVTVEVGEQHYLIDEGKGQITAGGTSETRPFKIAFTSQLAPVFAKILVTGTSDLPTYAQSSAVHLKMLAVMNEAFFGDASLERECPIT